MTKRQQAIQELNNYIWTLRGKCDGIVDINKSFIEQYCRFAVMADEVSAEIEKKLNTLDSEELEMKLKIYEKLQKTAINLYKTLKFEQVKDELASYGNPFMELSKEAENDGDL